ncbi:MAG: GntR family transcriptional regulator [Dehalococcoidia bacterium]|jgi:GntR family transcriptional regulator|nr:GntR family transcriptional regulator [Dehalococcoidia bacterium]
MLIAIDNRDPRPLYLQIAAQVKEQVQRGDLQPGDELPPVRELADSLGINLHTVRSAYIRLRDQGVIDLRLGRRARIARRQPVELTPAEADRTLGAQVRELVADAFLLGLSTEDLHALLDRQAGHSDGGAGKHDSHPEETP